MARPRSRLDKHSQAPEVLERLGKEPAGWKRERLLALKHGLEGEMSLDEIAVAVGRARSAVQRWFDTYRQHGLEAVLKKEHAGGIPSSLKTSIALEMIEKLRAGSWRRAQDAQRWLKQEHKVEVALSTVYKYLGKCEARLKVPRPSHAKKTPPRRRPSKVSWPQNSGIWTFKRAAQCASGWLTRCATDYNL